MPTALETFLARLELGSAAELWPSLEELVKRNKPRSALDTMRAWLKHADATHPEMLALGSLAQAEGVAAQADTRRQVAGALEDACLGR